MNDSLGDAVNVNVGLVAFGSGGKTADMGPAGGAQTFTSPPDNDDNSNTVPDVDEVIHSLTTEFGGAGALAGSVSSRPISPPASRAARTTTRR